MIKINLLPAHILERQRLRSAVILVVVVLLVEAAVLGVAMTKVKGRLADKKVELEFWAEQAAQVGKIEAETNKVQAQAQSYGRWSAWTDAIDRYHEDWAVTLEDVSKWISARLQVTALNPSPTAVSIQAQTDSLESFRKAYLNISRSPLFTNVQFSISAPSVGWQPPAAAGRGRAAARRASPAPSTGMGLGRRFEEEEEDEELFAGGTPRAGAAPRTGARRTAGRGTQALPVTVTFTCTLDPAQGSKLVPPPPPVGAAAAAGGRAGAAGGARATPRIGLRRSEMQEREGEE